jgi:hypothetical protein
MRKPSPWLGAGSTLTRTRRWANRWLLASAAGGAGWIVAEVVAYFAPIHWVRVTATVAFLVALMRYATLDGWYRGWCDRSVQEFANQLALQRPSPPPG